MKESAFKIKVLAFLEGLPNAWFTKTQQISIAGTPDIIGHINGIFIAIELKRDLKSKLTRLQSYNIDRINKSGAIALALYPENFDDAKSRLSRLANYKLGGPRPCLD